MPAKVLHGDCLAILPTIEANSIDAIVTDPPYHLTSQKQTAFANTTQMDTPHRRTQKGFMHTEWDGGDIAFRTEVWKECLRVLKPGGHMAVFGGSRTHHRVWCAIEDAGFEVRDTCMWLYGQGFPKSLDVSKAIDKHLGAEREVMRHAKGAGSCNTESLGVLQPYYSITAPATPEAEQWQGWGSALKPSHEPILIARKPLEGTLAHNVLEHGTGGINVDATRVGTESTKRISNAGTNGDGWGMGTHAHLNGSDAGRWPPNLLHDGSEEVVECFPSPHGAGHAKAADIPADSKQEGQGMFGIGLGIYGNHRIGDEGSAARFFPQLGYSDDERRVLYCPKASKLDRAGSSHPTIKPIKLMEWLCKLITPPGGTILDPFAGSGSTGEAASNLGFNGILIEQDDTYVKDIERRLAMFIA